MTPQHLASVVPDALHVMKQAHSLLGTCIHLQAMANKLVIDMYDNGRGLRKDRPSGIMGRRCALCISNMILPRLLRTHPGRLAVVSSSPSRLPEVPGHWLRGLSQ